MAQRTTSRDVATRAGVSQSTVSHVLTGRPGISEATRERVLAAMAELRYRPNLAARSMRTRKSGRLAVVLPLTTPGVASILSGAAEAAREAGYVLELQGLTGSAKERTHRLLDMIDTGEFEGILSFTDLPGNLDEEDEHTTVLVLPEYDEDLHVSGAMVDAGVVTEIVEQLATQGHRRFLHLAGPEEYASARARRAVYEKAIADHGLESLGVVTGPWSGRSGERAIRELPPGAPPLAVIAANDVIAAGAIRGALARGWTVPGDLSVTGWDDLPLAGVMVPALTTVSIDRRALGAYAVRRLLAAMRGDEEPPGPGSLTRVIWRESAGAPPPKEGNP